MKKESKRTGFTPEESRELEPSLHDLYFTEDIDMEEELRRIEEDPRLKDVTGDPGTLDKIKAEWARREQMESRVERATREQMISKATEVELSEELANLSPEARELVELGMKTKSEECEDESKVRMIRKRSKRIFFAVAAILVMSMAAGTTGVTSLYKYLQSEDKGEKDQYRFVDSETDTVLAEVNEVGIYQQVDKFFGAPVVKLYGHLTGLDFSEVLFHEEDMSVDLVYYWNDKSIFYSIQSNFNQLSHMSFLEENLIAVKEVEISNTIIKIQKYDIDLKDNYKYMVSYHYNGLYYEMDIIQMTEKSLYQIINNLVF